MIWPMVRNSRCPQDVQDNGVEYGVLVSIDVVTSVRYHLHSAILQAWLLYTVDTVTGVSIGTGGHNIRIARVLLYIDTGTGVSIGTGGQDIRIAIVLKTFFVYDFECCIKQCFYFISLDKIV